MLMGARHARQLAAEHEIAHDGNVVEPANRRPALGHREPGMHDRLALPAGAPMHTFRKLPIIAPSTTHEPRRCARRNSAIIVGRAPSAAARAMNSATASRCATRRRRGARRAPRIRRHARQVARADEVGPRRLGRHVPTRDRPRRAPAADRWSSSVSSCASPRSAALRRYSWSDDEQLVEQPPRAAIDRRRCASVTRRERLTARRARPASRPLAEPVARPSCSRPCTR